MTLYQSSFLTSPVEFPCGRTALTAQSGVYTRSVLHYENANTTSLTNTNTTPYPPSTPATTTVSFMDTRNRRKKLPRGYTVTLRPPLRSQLRLINVSLEVKWSYRERSHGRYCNVTKQTYPMQFKQFATGSTYRKETLVVAYSQLRSSLFFR